MFTDKETVKVVEEVLANEINKQIVNSINETGGKAIGLAGNRDNLIKASKLKVSEANFSIRSCLERLITLLFKTFNLFV